MQDYGKGFAWSIPYLNINQGDYVIWTWNAPGTISNIKYSVQQVADQTSTNTTGFTSGSPSVSGFTVLHSFFKFVFLILKFNYT